MSSICYMCGSKEGNNMFNAPYPHGIYWLCNECMLELVNLIEEKRKKSTIELHKMREPSKEVFPAELMEYIGDLVRKGKHPVVSVEEGIL